MQHALALQWLCDEGVPAINAVLKVHQASVKNLNDSAVEAAWQLSEDSAQQVEEVLATEVGDTATELALLRNFEHMCRS